MKRALLPALCGLFVSILSASAVPLLTLIEESSTVLTWSWSAGFAGSGILPLVDPLVPDHWAGDIPSPQSVSLLIGGFVSWREPNESLVNLVLFTFGPSAWHVEVFSDFAAAAAVDDGTVVQLADAEGVFFDRGDQPGNHVPDSGGILSMMVISLAGLALCRRYTSRCSLQRG